MGEDSNGITDHNLPILQFPFISDPINPSPEHPLQTRASIPFKWEEQPGKPRACPEIIARSEPDRLSLELPPCRKKKNHSFSDDPITKTTSPTTVLDGPHGVGSSKFSSLRIFASCERDQRGTAKSREMKRNSSFSEGLSSNPLASIYKCLKQAVKWNMTRKSSKETNDG